MKRYLILLQLTILVSCSTINLSSNSPDPERSPASPTPGDSCYLAMRDFLDAPPISERRANFVTALKEFSELHQAGRQALTQAVDWVHNKTPAQYSKDIRDLFDSTLFIDYKDSFETFYKAARDSNFRIDEVRLPEMYDGRSSTTNNTAFGNYKRAKEYLTTDPAFNLTTFKKVNQLMMEGGVDNTPLDMIGKMRTVDMMGNIPPQYAVTQEIYDEMGTNIYLNLSGMIKNPQTGKYYGAIYYSSIEKMTPQLKEKVKELDPALALQIEKYLTQRVGDRAELTSKFVTALTEDLLKWFVKQRDDIGDVNTPQKLYKYAQAVATFQRNLVSIHPFRNGNGRTTREFAIYHLFESIGFPAPRIIDPNDDVYNSIATWTDAIIEGIRNSQRLYDSAEKRMAMGLSLEGTPELLVAKFKETAKVDLKTQSPASRRVDYKNRDVPIEQVQQYIIMQRTADPTIKDRMLVDSSAEYDKMLNAYYAFFKKSNLDYVHERRGLEELSINLVEPDFMAMFAKKSYKNINKWKFKMSKWYSDNIVWRGLSRRDRQVSQNEILSMFQEVNQQFMSNNLLRQVTPNMTPKQKNDLIFKDFAQYNQDTLTDGLEKMAKDHSETGPMYGQSYGYSTSLDRKVGKAFAMGAMVVAPYGQHQQPQYQQLLKARVLVGMKKAKKDVQLGRLKQLRPNFSYRYPRQQEVMGIGAADPDSVMFVQLISAEGGVIKSYVRNPQKPNEILVFDSEVSSFDDIDFDHLDDAVERLTIN